MSRLTFPDYMRKSHVNVDPDFRRDQTQCDIVDVVAVCFTCGDIEVYDDLLAHAKKKLRSPELTRDVRDNLNMVFGSFLVARDLTEEARERIWNSRLNQVERTWKKKAVDKRERRKLFD